MRGNHDAYVIGELQPDSAKVAAYRTDWTRTNLDTDHLRWLGTLPVGLHFRWGVVQLMVRHANPWDEETYLYPDSARLGEISLPEDAILVVGHTHRPLLRQADLGWVLNPGSVGQPRDRNPQASYALLDTHTKVVEHRRAAYDVQAYQRYLEGLDWPKEVIRVLSREKTNND